MHSWPCKLAIEGRASDDNRSHLYTCRMVFLPHLLATPIHSYMIDNQYVPIQQQESNTAIRWWHSQVALLAAVSISASQHILA